MQRLAIVHFGLDSVGNLFSCHNQFSLPPAVQTTPNDRGRIGGGLIVTKVDELANDNIVTGVRFRELASKEISTHSRKLVSIVNVYLPAINGQVAKSVAVKLGEQPLTAELRAWPACASLVRPVVRVVGGKPELDSRFVD